MSFSKLSGLLHLDHPTFRSLSETPSVSALRTTEFKRSKIHFSSGPLFKNESFIFQFLFPPLKIQKGKGSKDHLLMRIYFHQNKLSSIPVRSLQVQCRQERHRSASAEVVLCANQDFTRSSLAFPVQDYSVARAILLWIILRCRARNRYRNRNRNRMIRMKRKRADCSALWLHALA